MGPSEQLGGHAWQTVYVAYGARRHPGLVQAVSEPAQGKNRLANLGLEKGPPSVLSLSFLTCSCMGGMHVCMFVIRHTCMHMLMEAQG